jgi:hypothetical protein
MRLFKVRIRQGRLAVMANNINHAEAQAKALERDLSRYWVRAQAHVTGDLYALGSAARKAVA